VTRFLLYLGIAAVLMTFVVGAAAPWLEEYRPPVRDDWRFEEYRRRMNQWT
jgi:hypothetical protein